jgi:hypothetical protein
MVRTSVLFGRGVGPYGITKMLYGGEPEPDICMDKVAHCWGVVVKDQV